MNAVSVSDTDAPAVTGSVVRIGTAVTRIVAPNPGPLTGPGTNTYVIGSGENCVVLDPGPDDALHLERILAASGGRIGRILCTHSHPDHSPGAAVLRARTGAQVYGLPAPHDGFQDPSYAPDEGLSEGEEIPVCGDRLTALHTPGHASNHVCFVLESSRLLFTGDHLMSGSTVVILPPDGSMLQYLGSLERLLGLDLGAIAPGHGSVIPDAHADIRRVLAHRLKREGRLVEALSRRGRARLDELLPEVYDDVPRFMHPAARYSLLAHAIKLAEEGRVVEEEGAYCWLG
jgi:glyoxylase-like metal-dependent hydrolase (beta-lactamase superfamily II)